MSEPDPVSQPMRCMEIRGGSRAVRESIATPGLDLWVFSEPYHAEAQGGDVHYVSLCGGGVITRIIVADVSGHGQAVAGFSDALRTLMRRNINSKDQKKLVGALNRQFVELDDQGHFATAVVATYLATTGRLAVCNAAHPRPLLYRADLDRWSVLTPATGRKAMNLPLGVDASSTYDQFSVELGPGDVVVFYTDALTEARGARGNLLGEPGLLEIARTLDARGPARLGDGFVEAIRRYQGGDPAEDDVTVLVLRHNGTPPRPPSIGEKLDVYAKVFGIRPV